jgi:hypothetical protein
MKKLFLLIGLVPSILFAQQADTTIQIGLKPKIFAKVLNQQFSGLVTGQSKNTLGNFASLDLKDAEVSFAGNTIFSNGSVFGIKATGSVTDGLFDLFSNSKLNTKIGMEFQYHFLALRKRQLTYYDDSYRRQMAKEKEIRNKAALRIAFLETDQVKDSVIRAINKLQTDSTKLAKFFDDILTKIDDDILHNRAAEHRADTLTRDSLRYAITEGATNMAYARRTLKALPDHEDLIMDAENARSRAIQDNETAIEVYAFQIGWFSLSYKFQNDAFKLFSKNESYDNQVEKKNYTSHEITGQYSLYKYSNGAFESFYLDAGVGLGISNNLGELDKTQITETELVGSSTAQREVTNTYDVYSKGDYEERIKTLRVYGDAYYFLFKDNIAAIHVFPEVQKRESYKPVSNLGVGFLVSFKDKEDEKSNVNAELYYNFLDVFKVKESTFGFFERNSIGIRFAFPMNFKTKTK